MENWYSLPLGVQHFCEFFGKLCVGFLGSYSESCSVQEGGFDELLSHFQLHNSIFGHLVVKYILKDTMLRKFGLVCFQIFEDSYEVAFGKMGDYINQMLLKTSFNFYYLQLW